MDTFLMKVVAPILLALIMVGMGLSLVIDDFKRIFVYPKAATIGIVGQMIILPIIGFVVSSLFPLRPELAVGVMILAACPGGVASNVVSHLSKGDTALSVTLTVLSSFLAVISVPLIISIALHQFMGAQSEIQLPIVETSFKVFLITIPTILLGMLIRSKFPDFAHRAIPWVKVGSALFLLMLMAVVIYQERAHVVDYSMQAGPVSFVLCSGTAVIAFLLSRIFKLNREQSISITVEVGFQNSTLAIVIATSFLGNVQMAIPPGVYTLVMYLLSGLLIAYMNLRKEESAAAG